MPGRRSLAAVVSVISAGLLLLVYGETKFHLVRAWSVPACCCCCCLLLLLLHRAAADRQAVACCVAPRCC